MSVTNLYGQPIEVGALVHRGARDGDGTTYRLGFVTKVLDSGKVAVDWKFGTYYSFDRVAKPLSLHSTVDPKGLVPFYVAFASPEVLEALQA